MAEVIVVAALSARMLAQCARASGYVVEAIDLFGDSDTRAAASHWSCGGEAAGLAIDSRRLLAGLAAAAHRHASAQLVGWVAGSGFEGRSELLLQGSRVLPLIGSRPESVRRVRDPARFFSLLDERGMAHPPVTLSAPTDDGWLTKDAWSCGGWQVRRVRPGAGDGALPEGQGHYFQRETAGEAMSVLFVADGRRARVLGFSRQLVRPLAQRPFVHHGCVGPLELPPAPAQRLAAIANALVDAFSLRGLNGLDFLLRDDDVTVLELNPRPTASIALHEASAPGGLMRAHVAACRGEALPAPGTLRADGRVRGVEVLFARCDGAVTPSLASALARRGWCHDLPSAARRFARGDPLCSVSASAADEASVYRLLAQRRTEILELMEQHYDRAERPEERVGA